MYRLVGKQERRLAEETHRRFLLLICNSVFHRSLELLLLSLLAAYRPFVNPLPHQLRILRAIPYLFFRPGEIGERELDAAKEAPELGEPRQYTIHQ